MPKMTKKYISWMLSALMCFNSSFTVIQAEESAQTEKPEILEMMEETKTQNEQPEAAVTETVEEPAEEIAAQTEETAEPTEEVLPEETEVAVEETEETPEPEQEKAGEETTLPAEETEEPEPTETAVEEATEPVEVEEDDTELAATTDPSDFTYRVNSDGSATITGYNGDEEDVITPLRIDGYPVKGIGEYAFEDAYFNSVVISTGVTTIEEGAFFMQVSLTKVTLPNTLKTIGEDAFRSCGSLATINMPSSVTSIGDGAFYECSELLNEKGYVIFKNTIFYYEGDDSSVTIPSGIKRISKFAFSELDNLVSVTIPSSVTGIGYGAFYRSTNLKNLSIPSGLTDIGDSAFEGCSSLADSQGLVIVNNVLFDYFGDDVSITIPKGVKTISENAFDHCSSIVSISIPDSVSKIGEFAFASCTNLSSISIPEGITSIKNGSFFYCSNLASVYLPGSLTFIEESAFYKCTSLKDVYYNGTKNDWYNIEIGENNEALSSAKMHYAVETAFTYYVNNNGTLTITGFDELEEYPENVTIPSKINGKTVEAIGEYAFECSGITSITIPDTVKRIEDDAFIECSELVSITLPNSLKIIGAFAFAYCKGLETINIPPSVTSIGEGMLKGCSKLADSQGFLIYKGVLYDYYGEEETVVIPEKVEQISASVFEENTAVKNVIIPTGVTRIGSNAFMNCENLEPVSIPSSVTEIGDGAFYGCAKLADQNDFIIVNNILFQYTGTAYAVAIPDSIIRISSYAFEFASAESIMIPDSVKGIGNSAFMSCYRLTSIRIPYGISVIEPETFADCSKLKTVVIPDSVLTVKEDAFNYCSSLTDVYYGGTSTQWKKIAIEEGNEILTSAKINYGSDPEYTFVTNTNGTIKITGYQGNDTDLLIPSKINGKAVSEIGDYVFESNENLASVIIPNTVKTIGAYAFRDCINLIYVSIPDSVTSCGIYVFSGCTSLLEVVLPDSVSDLAYGSFRDCTSLENVVLPNNMISIGSYAFKNCYSLSKITIPEGITYISSSTFAGCDSLSSVHLPHSVNSIYDSAFEGCESLDDIEMTNVSYIGSSALKNCVSLTKINANAISYIGANAFEGCDELIEIGKICTDKIGSYAFMDCVSLGTLYITDALTSIETGAFRYCSDDITIHFYGTRAQWDSVAIYNYNSPLNQAQIIYHAVPNSIETTVQEMELAVNERREIPIKVSPEGIERTSLIWRVFPSGIVDIDESGTITGLAAGKATVTISSPDLKIQRSIVVTCKVIELKTISVFAPINQISVGQTILLESKFTPENASDKNIGWVSDDDGIATVSEDGVLTAKSAGSVSIYAISEDGKIKSNVIRIQVTVPVSGVHLLEPEVSLVIRESVQLTAIVEPENAYDKIVTWLSNNENIAVVDANGVVTAVSEGTAVITATTADGGFTDNCTVTCYTVYAEGISVNEEESVSEIEFGKTGSIQITFEPINTTNQNLVWSSSDESIATVDENGIITAVGEGSVTITATSEDGGFTTSKTIDVFYNHIEKVAFAEEAAETVIGKTRSLNILFTPENASNKAVTYVSSNEDIATVDKEGTVTGISEGTAEITVTTEDGNHIAVCTVRVMPNGVYIKGLADSYTYTGSAFKPEIQIYDSGILLTPKTDYTITYKNNTKAYTLTEDDSEFNAKKAPQIILKSNSKGNYKGSKTIYFIIEPLDINDEQITVDELSAQAGTKPISPVPVVYFNGKKLKNKTDFTVDYNGWNQMDSGDITIKIHGKGNFQGTRDVTVHAAAQGMTSVAKLKVISGSVRYTDFTGDFMTDFGSRIIVKDGNTTLLKDVEYEIIEDSAKNCDQIGTCTFTIQGKGKYYGKRTVSVKITGTSMTDKKIKTVIPVYQYTGQEIELNENFAVLYDGEVLQKGVDYVVDDYANNINAGKATAVLKGINRFTGTKKVTYTIAPVSAQLSENQITVSDAVYEKSGAKAPVKIEGMTEGVDYTVKYKNNTKANTYGTAEIIFKDNYKGTASVKRQFFIQPKDISGISIAAKDKVYSAKANAWKSMPVLTDADGKKLKTGTDYEKEISYTAEDGSTLPSVISAGTVVKVTVTGKGNYTGKASTTYRILNTGRDISKAAFKITPKEYTGSEVTLTVADITATINKTTLLKLGTDYEIASYTNNIKKGTAKVTFRGLGEYGGTKTVSFKIGQRSISDYWQGIKDFFAHMF